MLLSPTSAPMVLAYRGEFYSGFMYSKENVLNKELKARKPYKMETEK